MKNLTYTVLMLIGFGITFSSCKKNNIDEKNNDNDKDYYFTVKIDDTSFTADMSNPAVYGASKPNANSLAIVAVKKLASPGDGMFQLNLGNTYTGPGTYDLGEKSDANNFASYTLTENSQPTLWEARDNNGNGSSGTLTITTDANGVVEGTFKFAGIRTTGTINPGLKHITEGKFKVKLN